jgi:hypothetical protein
VCSLHIFDAAAGNAWLGLTTVVAAALGHVKDLASNSSDQFGTLWLLVQPARVVTVASCEQLANCPAQEGAGWDRSHSFFGVRFSSLSMRERWAISVCTKPPRGID